MDTTEVTIDGISPPNDPSTTDPTFELKFLKNKIYDKKFRYYCSNYEYNKDFDDSTYAQYPPGGLFIEIKIVNSCSGLSCLGSLKITES